MITCHHKKSKSNDLILTGIIANGQLFTQPLIPPRTKHLQPTFQTGTQGIYECEEDAYRTILEDMDQPVCFCDCETPIGPQTTLFPIPVHAMRTATERKLWHNRLCHFSPQLINQAHKYVDGVPEFKGDPLCSELDKCPTCIKAKLTKVSPGDGTDEANQPYQVIAMDFSFSGVVSKDTKRRKDIMGINGETSWILAQDVFSKMLHCDTRLSKASPLNWIDEFLTKYKPHNCRRRFIILDQGGELYGNPKVQKIIKKHEYDIMPTGADASFQNPCERYH